MIFIEGNFPSFKNSKQFTGKFFIMSKTVQKYLKAWEWQWEYCGELQIDFSFELLRLKAPYKIGMHFVRGTKHKYDWVNMVQGVQDLMVKHGWIEDDNTDVMYPFPLEINNTFSSYDKEKPGVYIKILNSDKS